MSNYSKITTCLHRDSKLCGFKKIKFHSFFWHYGKSIAGWTCGILGLTAKPSILAWDWHCSGCRQVPSSFFNSSILVPMNMYYTLNSIHLLLSFLGCDSHGRCVVAVDSGQLVWCKTPLEGRSWCHAQKATDTLNYPAAALFHSQNKISLFWAKKS